MTRRLSKDFTMTMNLKIAAGTWKSPQAVGTPNERTNSFPFDRAVNKVANKIMSKTTSKTTSKVAMFIVPNFRL